MTIKAQSAPNSRFNHRNSWEICPLSKLAAGQTFMLFVIIPFYVFYWDIFLSGEQIEMYTLLTSNFYPHTNDWSLHELFG